MELEIGAILEGKVTGITKFGAFVSLPGGRSGLVHISEVAYSYVNDVNEFLTVGQDVKVKIIGIDPNNRINLSIKQTLPPPPRQERAPRQGGGHRGGYQPRENRGEHHGEHHGNDRPRSGGGRTSRPTGGAARSSGPKEPLSFEDMMKQYMSESETKLSQLNRGERSRGRRRGRGGSGGGSF